MKRRRLLPAGAAALHLALGLLLNADPRNMHDEGQSMYGFSRALGDAFWPCLFFQKIKPALALFYLLPSRFGFLSYLLAHLVVGSLAVYLLGRVAESTGQKRPWLPALILALSPLYSWTSATGIANADGAAGIVLFLYLLESRRMLFAAGLVLGALPWVRFESIVFCAILGPYVLYRERSARFVLGVLAWPVLYAIGGAIYHGNPLWFVALKPAGSAFQAWHQVEAAAFAQHTAKSAVAALLCVSIVLPLLVFIRPRRLLGIERALLAFTIAFVALFVAAHVVILPIGPLFIVGFAARHALLPIAAVALLAGRAVEAMERDRTLRVRPIALLALLVVGAAWTKRIGVGPGPLVSIAAMALVVAAARARRPGLGIAAMVGLAVAGRWFAKPTMTSEGYSHEFLVERGRVEEMASALEALGAARLSAGVNTNNHLLQPYLVRTGRLPGVPIRFMVSADMNFEMNAQTNPHNGQRGAVLNTIPRAMFGDAVRPDELSPGRVPIGTVFALTDDTRVELILPEAAWRERLVALPSPPGMRLAVVER